MLLVLSSKWIRESFKTLRGSKLCLSIEEHVILDNPSKMFPPDSVEFPVQFSKIVTNYRIPSTILNCFRTVL